MKQQIQQTVKELLPGLTDFYKELHLDPELSLQERETSKKVAAALRAAGFEVTEGVGGHGVVGVCRNGDGPTAMVRTDIDALPVQEKTGLPFASTKTMEDKDGNTVPVMHACGHDLHMTNFRGVAETMSRLKDHWKGTLLFVAQPAEEIGQGAKNMLEDGLYSRFPVPDFNFAYHIAPFIESGKIGHTPGFCWAGVDMLDLHIYGVGGHGAYPHTTIDPVVLAAKIILDLQTIVSREVDPFEPAVVTVGSIQGGSKHNIIPDVVKLQLTTRNYSQEVREQLLRSIKRIAEHNARAAGLPDDKMPVMTLQDSNTPAVYNDPNLDAEAAGYLAELLGEENIEMVAQQMAGEDFGLYGMTEETVPSSIFWLGVVPPDKMKQHKEKGLELPQLHSPFLAPDVENGLRTGVSAMSYLLIKKMGG